MTHFMKVYFHTCQSLFTAYFRKMLSFEMHFYQTFGFSMFSNIYLNTSKKKTNLLFRFWFCDSRVIIVTYLPSFESADSEFYFTTYTRSAKSKLCGKASRDHMFSLSLSLLADADPESFDNFFIFHVVLADEEREDPNTTKAGRHRPASETPFAGLGSPREH